MDPLKAKRLCIQYESLHRLVDFTCYVSDFDYVIIDELRSVFAQAVSPHNKGNVVTNWFVMEKLLVHCRCLLMGADIELDGMCKMVLGSLFEPHMMRFDRYTATVLPRRVNMMDEDHLMGCIKWVVENGYRVGVCFRSIVRMQAFMEMDFMQGRRVKSFSSDSSDEDMKTFATISAYLREFNIQVLAFTSKCTVAADITYGFDWLFLHGASASGPCAREVWQMLGRFRKLFNLWIQAYLGEDSPFATNASLEEELSHIVARTDAAQLFFQGLTGSRVLDLIASDFDKMDEYQVMRRTPSKLMRIAAYSLMEHNQDFQHAFVKLLQHKAIPFSVSRPQNLAVVGADSAQLLAQIVKALKADGDTRLEEMATAVIALTDDQREEVYTSMKATKIDQQTRHRDERQLFSLLCKHYSLHGSALADVDRGGGITVEHLTTMEKKYSQCRMHKELFLMTGNVNSEYLSYHQASKFDAFAFEYQVVDLRAAVTAMSDFCTEHDINLSNAFTHIPLGRMGSAGHRVLQSGLAKLRKFHDKSFPAAPTATTRKTAMDFRREFARYGFKISSEGKRDNFTLIISEPEEVLVQVAAAFLSGAGLGGRAPTREAMRERTTVGFVEMKTYSAPPVRSVEEEDQLFADQMEAKATQNRNTGSSVARGAFNRVRDVAEREAEDAYAEALTYNNRYRQGTAESRKVMMVERMQQELTMNRVHRKLTKGRDTGEFLQHAAAVGLSTSRRLLDDPTFNPFARIVPFDPEPVDNWRPVVPNHVGNQFICIDGTSANEPPFPYDVPVLGEAISEEDEGEEGDESDIDLDGSDDEDESEDNEDDEESRGPAVLQSTKRESVRDIIARFMNASDVVL